MTRSFCQKPEYSMKHKFYTAIGTATLLMTSMYSLQAASAELDVQNATSLSQKVGSEHNQLQPFKAVYKAFRNGSELGHALMQLQKQGDHYKLYYESDVSMFFLSDRRTETSLFRFADGDFQQIEYQYVREGTGRDKALNLKFNAETQKITKDDKDVFNWQGEWDNQLYRFDLQRKIKEQASDISYNLINYRGQLKTYGFEIIGEEVLELPFGKLNTIKVRTIRASKKRETFSWFAPDLNYQLVRLQQFKKGNEQGDIRLSEFTAGD